MADLGTEDWPPILANSFNKKLAATRVAAFFVRLAFENQRVFGVKCLAKAAGEGVRATQALARAILAGSKGDE
jgi:hypothetical protein